MKIRVITGLLAAMLGIGLLVILQSVVPMLLLIPVVAIASYEILHTAKVKNKLIIGLSLLCSAAMPLILSYDLLARSGVSLSVFLVGYCIAMLLCMLVGYEKTRFEHVAIALYASLFIPFALSSVLLVRHIHLDYPSYFQPAHSLFFVLIAMTSAWISDTAAFFVGSKFGKHKLAPRISPKKSVEGAVGAVVFNVIINTIIFLICDANYFYIHSVKLWMVIAASLVLSVLSMTGDLSASVIKRNFNQKDFGNLIPGHGGIMDRFDSFSFVMPVLWMMLTVWMQGFAA